MPFLVTIYLVILFLFLINKKFIDNSTIGTSSKGSKSNISYMTGHEQIHDKEEKHPAKY